MNSTALIDTVDFLRLDANRKIDPDRRSDLGQFMTPPGIAGLMASMFEARTSHLKILDAGAGVGSLSAALISELCSREIAYSRIELTAYEVDADLAEYLQDTLRHCGQKCRTRNIEFDTRVIVKDFIGDSVAMLRGKMFAPVQQYDCAILNPPYRKIASDSEARWDLREVGIEATNLYAAFLSLTMQLLAPGGELVAIIPRSFCNGPYFKPFREDLLSNLSIRRLHLFASRQLAFSEDEVLQENVIIHGVKERPSRAPITISSSTGSNDDSFASREVPYHGVVKNDDPELFIHIVADELGTSVATHLNDLNTRLPELGLGVSTGRVVDFRAKEHLLTELEGDCFPLIYPRDFENGIIVWPRDGGKKPKALARQVGTESLLIPKGLYVLVKRFSAKEEPRRVVAAVYDPDRIDAEQIGFENHTNYYHRNGTGLPRLLACGLNAFLNSTLLDLYFRQFNGHTQVNATDLRNLRYPSTQQLEALGRKVGIPLPPQDLLDRYVSEEVFGHNSREGLEPLKAKKKVDQALAMLQDLGFPAAQQDERSALTLLALLNISPKTPWSAASNPLMGITPMMDFFSEQYGKNYAPNSRETVRRQTIHQFVDAGIALMNPDLPTRPTNSGKFVYQIEPSALELLRQYGSGEYKKALQVFLSTRETLKSKYAQARLVRRIPLTLAPGKNISLSPGGQNILVAKVLREFCSIFILAGVPVYVGDTDQKWAYFDGALLSSLGVEIADPHGKMPDVIVFDKERHWLFLIEAVTSHGPVNPKRRIELEKLFHASTAGIVYVTAFLTRSAMVSYLNDISWETEVWVADAPEHLIHFNGERFLGPYGD